MEFINLYMRWYYSPYVKFNMIRITKNREFAMINLEDPKKNIRNLRFHSVQHLTGIFNCMSVYRQDKIYNLYYSLASYDGGLPYRDILRWTKEEDIADFKKDGWKKMTGYDYAIDIDGHDDDLENARQSMLKVHAFFNAMKVPHEIRFSGKGYHLIIPSRYISHPGFDPWDKKSTYKQYAKLLQRLYEDISEMVDTSIADYRRVIKLPYSLACYKDVVRICLPLLDEQQVREFRPKDADPDLWDPYDLKDRGTKIFNEKGDTKRLMEWVIDRGTMIFDEKGDTKRLMEWALAS